MKQEKKLNKAKLAFKNSFIKLMGLSDFDDISVSDIVTDSGYSRQAFYSYYQDKYDFVNQLVDAEMLNYVAVICEPILERKRIDLNASIYPPALNFFNHVYNNQKLYHLIINNQIPTYSIEKFCENANKRFNAVLSLEMSPDISSELNYDFYTYIGTYTYMLYIKFWEKTQYSYPPEYMASQVTYMIRMKKINAIVASEPPDN